jgi:hypothetical protein
LSEELEKGFFYVLPSSVEKCNLACRLGRGIRHIRKATNPKGLEQTQSLGFSGFLAFLIANTQKPQLLIK